MSSSSPACHSACHAASSSSTQQQVPAMPPLPPGRGPTPSASANMPPPIAQMLYREGDAWSSLLALHTNVITNLQLASASISCESVLDTDAERELQYVSTLSQAAAHCDQLHAEIIKLRTLRKTRSQYDLSALQPILRAHTSETVAVGTSLASQVSMTIQTVASEIRATMNEIKKTEAELISLYEMLATCSSHAIPCDFIMQISHNGRTKSIPLSSFVEIIKRHWTPAEVANPNASHDACGTLTMKSLLEDESLFGESAPSSSEEGNLKQAEVDRNIRVRRAGDRAR